MVWEIGSSSTAPSPSSSRGRKWIYDVFLNFCDENNNLNYISGFCLTLLGHGVKTLVHQKKGDFCPPNLLEDIQHCRISVVVFSKNYAHSTWCLDELAMIAHSIDSVKQFVVPVFWDVKSSVAICQNGVYHQPFAQHQLKNDLNKVNRWRNAMTKVAKTCMPIKIRSLQDLQNFLIRAKNNSSGDNALSFMNELTEIQCYVDEFESILDLGSVTDTQVIGICGSAKTIVASTLYERIYHKFDAHCFFKISFDKMMPYSAANIENNILEEILKQSPNVEDVHMETVSLATRLRNLKTLIVVDEFYDTQILEKLARSSTWFGAGSRIIIINTYESELEQLGVDNIYTFEIPNKEAYTRYGLSKTEFHAFKEIACFFVGEEIYNVIEILGDCFSCSKEAISTLIEKSIVSISSQKVQMHYILQNLVRNYFPSDPRLSSRVWFNLDTFLVMRKPFTEVSKCGALVFNPEDVPDTPLWAGALSQMPRLRLLIIRNVNFFGMLHSLSNYLRHLSWHRFPFAALPLKFKPDSLVRLVMRDSSIKELWKELKTTLPSLKYIDLGGSKNLKEMPDFERLPNLEKVDFEGCIGLVQLPPSISFLQNLTSLNLRNCTSLESLPNSLFGMCSIEMLNVAGCSKFAKCLDFDDCESSIEEELLSNQELPSLEFFREIQKPLVACECVQDPLNSNGHGIENESLKMGVHVSLHKDSRDDFVKQTIEHKKGKRVIEFSDYKSKKVKISQMEDTHEACIEGYEKKTEEKRGEANSSNMNITAAEYQLHNCIVALDEIEGVSDNSYMKALEKFKDPFWRQAFLTCKRKKAWLNSLV